jgi:hypothetical protein
MALRNISNIHQNQNIHDLFFYNTNQTVKPASNYQQQQITKGKNENKMKSAQYHVSMKPATSVTSICSATSSSGSTKSSSSIKIRTSSPISSSESSSSSSSDYAQPPPPLEISPSKFMKAVRPTTNHKSRKSFQQPPQQPQQLQHFVSMKELAFEKLKKQQLIEHDLKHTFNLNNQLNARQLCPNVRLKSSGKLKCAIYNNLNHLTVHIIESRQLKCDLFNASSSSSSSSSSHLINTTPFDTYVKITMLPDVEQRFNKYQTPMTKCVPQKFHSSLSSLSNASSSNASSTSSNTNNNTTSSNEFTNNFYYDQKFSFEFDQMTDMNNRLVVSVWSHTHTLIGCFSFKIKHLLKSSKLAATSGAACWYHLLPLKYGMSKHLASKTEMKSTMRPFNQHPISMLTKSQTDLVSNLNKDLQGMQRIGLSVTRANEHESFGFTVTNACPCAIGKVEAGKSADRAGLRAGDFIACVNGQNVSRATCETVVKMIKACKLRLDVEIYREQTIIDASLCQGVNGPNEIDYIATKLLNGHLEYQQKLACKNYEQQQMFYANGQRDYESNGNSLNLQAVEYRLPEQQQQQQQQQQQPHQNVNQFGLEVVPEEEEEEEANEISDVVEDDGDDEEENFYQDLDMEAVERQHQDNDGYIYAQQKLRHVDSSSNDEDATAAAAYSENQYYAQKEAELLRKAAQQFYSSTNNECIQKANILSLRNLKLDDDYHRQHQKQSFNYF